MSFKFSTFIAGFATGLTIKMAMYAIPEVVSTVAAISGSVAVVGGLFAFKYAMQEITDRAKPQTPCTSLSPRKDTRLVL